MNIYVDESGSINNHLDNNEFFVIAMVRELNVKSLGRAYKRFVSSNIAELKKLDTAKYNSQGKLVKPGNRMFQNGKFKELKGSQFDREMKIKFLEFFGQKNSFEVYYIVLKNPGLSNSFCKNTARAFNFSIKNALKYFIDKGFLPLENCNLQLDERNEKTETKYFLENYLNTELILSSEYDWEFTVKYFDSANNKYIQIADVFANIMWSHLITNSYTSELKELRSKGIIKGKYVFPYYGENLT